MRSKARAIVRLAKRCSGFFFPNPPFFFHDDRLSADFTQQKKNQPTGLPSSSSSGPSTPLTRDLKKPANASVLRLRVASRLLR